MRDLAADWFSMPFCKFEIVVVKRFCVEPKLERSVSIAAIAASI